MNPRFEVKCRRAAELFDLLMQGNEQDFNSAANAPGIYVFFEGGRPIYVGRTRNLKQRLRAHTAKSHHSASFAFKLLRKKLNLRTTYTRDGSRSAIQEQYGGEFAEQIARVRAMQVRFLEVPDPIEQYLLELYAAMELSQINPDIDMQDFDTH